MFDDSQTNTKQSNSNNTSTSPMIGADQAIDGVWGEGGRESKKSQNWIGNNLQQGMPSRKEGDNCLLFHPMEHLPISNP